MHVQIDHLLLSIFAGAAGVVIALACLPRHHTLACCGIGVGVFGLVFTILSFFG